MKKYKLGIDLATKHIGVCVLDGDNNLIVNEVINLDIFTYEFRGMVKNLEVLKMRLGLILDLRKWGGVLFNEVEDYFNSSTPNWDIGIEVSNYGNSKWTNNFNFYAGVLYTMFLSLGCNLNINNIKLFNANQWEYLCGMKPSDKREKRKEQAREFVKAKLGNEYKEKWSEDQCDAYCIAYWLDELKNTDELHQEIKERKKRKDQKLQKLYFLERKIHAAFTQMNKLDVKRNAKARLTLQNKITTLTKELENVKKKTQDKQK